MSSPLLVQHLVLTRCAQLASHAGLLRQLLGSAYIKPEAQCSNAAQLLVHRTASSSSTPQGTGNDGPRKQQELPSSPSIMPQWFLDLLPGAPMVRLKAVTKQSKQSQSQAVQAADYSSSAAASTSSSASNPSSLQAQEDQMLERMRDADMDMYMEYLKQGLGESPRPALPPIPRTHPDYVKWYDWKRIMYLRHYQHVQIASHMSAEEKARVNAQGAAACIKDKDFVRSIAQRTNLYIEQEVVDLLEQYQSTRQRFKHMYKYVKSMGRAIPRTQDEQMKFKTWQKHELAQEAQIQQASAMPAECPMVDRSAYITSATLCIATGLTVKKCCGLVKASTPLQLQRPATERYESELKRTTLKPVRGNHLKRIKQAQDMSLKIRKRT